MTSDEERLGPRLATYSPERTNLLPALHAVHDLFGYLPGWALQRVGNQLHVPDSEVYGVATGYTEFRLEPPPAGLIQVCTGLSCRLAGADALVADAKRRTGEAVETTACLFLCALAPVVLKGEQFAGKVTRQRLAHLQEASVKSGENLHAG
ncbi:MAG: NAD(P)H-dependent oxidoreductase subunit E [Dehalococcoidia bacterium]